MKELGLPAVALHLRRMHRRRHRSEDQERIPIERRACGSRLGYQATQRAKPDRTRLHPLNGMARAGTERHADLETSDLAYQRRWLRSHLGTENVGVAT